MTKTKEPNRLVIPRGPIPGYVTRRCDIKQMTRVQSETLASITSGLQFAGKELLDGTPIKSPQHAIKWILENAVPAKMSEEVE